MPKHDEREAAFQQLLELFTPQGKLQSLFWRKPTTPTKADVFKILESVPYRTRVYQIIRLGAESQKNSAIGDFIASLEKGDYTERSLALSSVYGSRNGAHVMRALSDQSRTIRNAAISLVPIACSDEECVEAFVAATQADRTALLHGLSRRKRRIPIENFLRFEKTRDFGTFIWFSPFASRPFIEQEWEEIAPRFTPELWTRLARQHPELAAAKIRELVLKAESFDPRILLLANAVLRVIAKWEPELTLDLIKDLLRIFPLSKLTIQGVVPYKTAEIARLMLDYDAKGAVALDRSLGKLRPELLSELIEKQFVSTARGELWLKRFSASDRAGIFKKAPDAWRNPDGLFDVPLLLLLPSEIREQHASAHFNSPQLLTRPEQRLPYIQLMPWTKARSLAESFLTDPDATLRAQVLSPLILSIRFSRESTSEMLALFRERRFEQDPVRFSMLQAVANLPPSIWKPSHLHDLEEMIRSALDAKDLSAQSLCAIHSFLIRLMPFHFDKSSAWLATVMKERSVTGIGSFENVLNNEQVRRLGPVILPILRSWKTREHEQAILRVANSFGRRLNQFVELVEIVEELAERASSSSVSESALSVLQHQCRSRFHKLVPHLLQSDATWSLKYPVLTFLHERRDDLLTPYLGQNAISGKFSTGKTRIVPNFLNGFHRWTSTQRKIYCDSLVQMTKDLTRKTGDFFYALRILSSLPESPLEVFLRFTRSAKPEHAVVRDFSIQLLGTLDGEEGIEELVRCLEDDRARVAIYSLRAAIERIPAGRALQILESVPRKKMTVFKETIRLIGELRSPEAHTCLLKIAAESIDRNIRIALQRALWNYLEDSRTWEIFRTSAELDDSAISLHLARIPADVLGDFSRQEYLQLLARLFEKPDPRLRVALLNRMATMPITDSSFQLRESLFRSLESENVDEFTSATNALLSSYAIRTPETVTEATTRVLPRRRNLSALVTSALGALTRERGSYSIAVHRLLSGLSQDPKTSCLQAAVRVAVCPWADLKKNLCDFVAGAPFPAHTALAYIAAFQSAGSRPDASELDELEQAFSAHSSEQIRRFGLAALVGAASGNRGWTEERLARLRQYRQDASPLVSEAAEFTLPAAELTLTCSQPEI